MNFWVIAAIVGGVLAVCSLFFWLFDPPGSDSVACKYGKPSDHYPNIPFPRVKMTQADYMALPILQSITSSEAEGYPIGYQFRFPQRADGQFILCEVQDTDHLLANQWATIAPPVKGVNRYAVIFEPEIKEPG